MGTVAIPLHPSPSPPRPARLTHQPRCRHPPHPSPSLTPLSIPRLVRRTPVGMQRLSRLREELVAASQVEERVRIGRLQPRGRAELLRRLRVPARREERTVARLALPGAPTVERRGARLGLWPAGALAVVAAEAATLPGGSWRLLHPPARLSVCRMTTPNWLY